MKHLVPIVFLLGACDSGEQWIGRDEAMDIADNVSVDNDAALLARIEELEERVDAIDAEAKTTAAVTDAVAEQVSANAKIANENALRDMTRRGACGYRTVRPQPTPGVVTPVVISEPIPCTAEDLR